VPVAAFGNGLRGRHLVLEVDFRADDFDPETNQSRTLLWLASAGFRIYEVDGLRQLSLDEASSALRSSAGAIEFDWFFTKDSDEMVRVLGDALRDTVPLSTYLLEKGPTLTTSTASHSIEESERHRGFYWELLRHAGRLRRYEIPEGVYNVTVLSGALSEEAEAALMPPSTELGHEQTYEVKFQFPTCLWAEADQSIQEVHCLSSVLRGRGMTTYFRDCLQALAAKAERQAGEFPAIPANGHAPGELLRYLVLLREFSQTRMSHLLDRPQDLDCSGGLVPHQVLTFHAVTTDSAGVVHTEGVFQPLLLCPGTSPSHCPNWCVQARGAEGAAEPSPS